MIVGATKNSFWRLHAALLDPVYTRLAGAEKKIHDVL
jgi:hypothetical protein